VTCRSACVSGRANLVLRVGPKGTRSAIRQTLIEDCRERERLVRQFRRLLSGADVVFSGVGSQPKEPVPGEIKALDAGEFYEDY
jgi:hypothetical protein